MSILDIAIILILIMGFIIGFKKGAIKEASSLIGIILVFLLSFSLMKPVGNFLCLYLPFFKFTNSLEGVQSLNIIIYQFISFIVIFSLLIGIYAFLLKISGIIEKMVDLTLVLLLPSKIIGGIICLITSYLIIFILLLLPFKKENLFKDSKLYPFILDKTPIVSKYTEKVKTCITEIYNLDDKLDTKEADIYTVNLLLKYDIVNKNTIKKLIKEKKLTNINISDLKEDLWLN